jgi:hypothetical protein
MISLQQGIIYFNKPALPTFIFNVSICFAEMRMLVFKGWATVVPLLGWWLQFCGLRTACSARPGSPSTFLTFTHSSTCASSSFPTQPACCLPTLPSKTSAPTSAPPSSTGRGTTLSSECLTSRSKMVAIKFESSLPGSARQGLNLRKHLTVASKLPRPSSIDLQICFSTL